MPTPIYHITHIDNVLAMIASGNLVCKSQLVKHVDIAHSGIQAKRSGQAVPCGPGGVVHDYVPFYYAPRSPMLCAISYGRVEGYSDGQDPIAYLVTSVKAVIDSGIEFVFTDGHAAMALSNFYTNWRSDRHKIDWPLMESRMWNDTNADPDRKRRRQAEFLIYRALPVDLIIEIATRTRARSAQIQAALNSIGLNIPVAVRPNWYF